MMVDFKKSTTWQILLGLLIIVLFWTRIARCCQLNIEWEDD